MITPEIIQRINTLAHKKKSTGLTAEELAEQTKLRRIYLDNIKAQLKSTLDTIEFVEEAQTAMDTVKEDDARLPKYKN